MNKIIFKLNNESYSLFDFITPHFYDNEFSNYTNKCPTNVAFDFITLGYIVSLVDRKILRRKSEDGWTRSLNVEIPVIEIDAWQTNCKILEKALSFLSGDYWELTFVKRDIVDYENDFIKCWNKKKRIKINQNEVKNICMFSGGLDSFIGATDLLSKSLTENIFINIRGGGNSYKNNFDSARDAICTKFNIKEKNKYFKSYTVKPWKAIEDTTRARSFTFFAHAIAYATCFDNHINLIIPENGTISLNVPLNYGRYGSCSTRTTHPYYIKLLSKLSSNLGLNISFKNPYQFKTKGEMILECADPLFIKGNIDKTMSCSHPNVGRYQKDGKPGHCGTCLPCLIREAAEIKAFEQPITDYKNIFSDSTLSTYRCLKMRMMSFDKKNIKIDIQKNGPLLTNVSSFSDLYLRSVQELIILVNYLEKHIFNR